VGGPHEHVRAGLAGRIRAVGGKRRLLAELPVGTERAVDFVGGDVDETFDAETSRGIEQALGAGDIGGHEGHGIGDGAIHMGLGREIDHGFDGVLFEKVEHEFAVGDVAPGEDVALAAMGGFHVGQALAVAGVGQLVKVDDGAIVVAGEHVADEVGADEAASAGHEQSHDDDFSF